jgi:hypothetical protein
MTQPIYFSHLPALEESIPYLQEIWKRKILTVGGHGGRLH